MPIKHEDTPKDSAAPKVTLALIESQIESEQFAVFGGRLTICVLTLRNGYMVTGESSAVHEANYNKETGELIARQNAIKNIWPLEGYLLREELHPRNGDTRG